MTTVAVVGLGKIGLPLATLYASAGHQVFGCDIDPSVVDAVNKGLSPVGGEPGLPERVADACAKGLLTATTDTIDGVRRSDVVVVVVRATVDEAMQPDYAALDAAADAIGKGLAPGKLVILETTVPVGTTRQRFAMRLAEASGLAGGTFHVAYSPERVSSGSIFRDLDTYPKLVGGIDPPSGEAAASFYRSVLTAEVTLLPNAETAEFAKLAESVYRDVNIALANELAMTAASLGVDYATAAKASNSQPYSHLHAPGVGVGGHCIPVYPYLLLQAGDSAIVRQSRQVNDSMASYAVDKLATALGEMQGTTVLILGLSYRGGVKEAAFSSTHLLAAELQRRGARVLVHDPLFSDPETRAFGYEPAALPPTDPVGAVILQAMHPEYTDLDLASLIGCRVFLDGRRAFDQARVEAAGMQYLAIGLP